MNRNLYSVKDECSGTFLAPQVDDNNQTAIRNFEYALSHNDIMSFRKSDFSLWCVGMYDNDTGVLIPNVSPILLKRGDDYDL